ncbi:MAG TPA: response regulator, partial [Albitalea sp.]|nr:response regulator [Albitalea sp.]
SPGELAAAPEPARAGSPAATRFGGLSALTPLDGEDDTGTDVLLVEDSAIARRFLQVRLQQLGYRVHLAVSGDEALQLLRRERFALVFLDIVLGAPGSLDGLAVCQQIRHDPRLSRGHPPKVVIVTGLSGESDRVRGSLAGCDAYLTKPLAQAELLHALRTLDPRFSVRA